MWLHAVLTVALRGPAKGLLLASAAGWIVMAWLVTDHRFQHSQFTELWLAMILAMAPPLLLREIGRLWRTSLRRLRHLTIGWFLCGYLGVWLLAAVVLSSVFGWASVNSSRIAIAVALIAVWQCSPARQRCLNACHRAPTLRVFGTRAQCDSLRYGISIGCYCAAACGPVMFIVLLATDYHLVVMGLVAAMTTLERYLPARCPAWRLPMLRGRSIEWPDYSAAPSIST
jgi:predicted metal-binding membrane protein